MVGVKENNYLGEGKQVGFDLEVDKESLAGTFSYFNPNYDFLGNSIFYALRSEKNDVPTRGYENSIVSAEASTGFEQYKDINLTLGLAASYDDLSTLSSDIDLSNPILVKGSPSSIMSAPLITKRRV